MKQFYLFYFVAIAGVKLLSAQQETTYAFYKNHFNLINPAVTGTQGGGYLNLSLREQWVDVDNAPSTQAISMGFPHKNARAGVGFSLVNEKFNVEQQTNFAIDFSYRLPLANNSNLYLGLKAGGNAYRLAISDAKAFDVNGQISDPFLEDYSRFLPNIGAGIYYTSEKAYVSFSIPRLLNTSRQKSQDGQQTTATDRPHLFLSAGRRFSLSKSLAFNPSFLLSYVQAAPPQMTLDAAFSFNDSFEAGIQYTTTIGMGATALLSITDGFMVGYAYTTPVTNAIDRISNGTHELVLKIRLSSALQEEITTEETSEPSVDNQ